MVNSLPSRFRVWPGRMSLVEIMSLLAGWSVRAPAMLNRAPTPGTLTVARPRHDRASHDRKRVLGCLRQHLGPRFGDKHAILYANASGGLEIEPRLVGHHHAGRKDVLADAIESW